MRMAGIASVNHSILTLKGNATYSVFGYLEFVVLFFLIEHNLHTLKCTALYSRV